MAGPDLSGRRVGGFELISPLATGGFATVYRARQVRLDREVAVKVLDPTLARDPDIAARFEREGRAAASLDHPNVVTVYEAGEDDGLVYLAMRLVEGETLDDLLLRRGPLTTERTVEYVRPVAAALDHAHERGLIHRDVKPSNVFIDGDRVWLGDFGIAASADQVGRYTTGALGTAHYMAPEQASQGELDGRADLYGLGCVVHRCLTNRPPYDRGELVATLVAHVSEPVPQLGQPALDRFLARALAKDPDDRFTTGAELVEALTRAGELPPPTPGTGASQAAAKPAPPTRAPATPVPPAPPPTRSPTPAEEADTQPDVEPAGAAVPPPPSAAPAPGSSPAWDRSPLRWLVPLGLVGLLVGAGVVVLTRGDGGSGGNGGPSGDARVGDPVAVGARPLSVDAGPDAVFTGNLGDLTLSEAPRAGGSVATAELGGRPTDVAVGGDEVWVTTQNPDRAVLRFDLSSGGDGPRTFAVAASGFEAARAAADDDGVWVSDPDGGRVLRLDAAGQPVGVVAVGGEPGDLALGSGSVWVADAATDELVRIDPDTFSVSERVPLEGAAGAVAVDDAAVYVTDRDGGTVTRVDTSDTSSLTTAAVVDRPTRPEVGAGGLWLLSPDTGTVHRYDLESLEEDRVVEVGGRLGSLTVEEDRLWVTRVDADALVPVDL